MAFTISEPIDPVEPPDSRSTFRVAIEALTPGKAVIVGGMTQSNCGSRARAIGRASTPHKSFSTLKLADGRIQLTRIS